jgi:hypothetical protein
MKISSEIKDQAKYLESYVVLDTVTAAGKFAVGLGIGNVAREGLYLTPVGQAAYERLKELGKTHLSWSMWHPSSRQRSSFASFQGRRRRLDLLRLQKASTTRSTTF